MLALGMFCSQKLLRENSHGSFSYGIWQTGVGRKALFPFGTIYTYHALQHRPGLHTEHKQLVTKPEAQKVSLLCVLLSCTHWRNVTFHTERTFWSNFKTNSPQSSSLIRTKERSLRILKCNNRKTNTRSTFVYAKWTAHTQTGQNPQVYSPSIVYNNIWNWKRKLIQCTDKIQACFNFSPTSNIYRQEHWIYMWYTYIL